MAQNDYSTLEEFLQLHYRLHYACYVGNEACVRDLLMSGQADVYQEDGLQGWTPLHWAACQGKWKCLEVLGQIRGVDLDVTNTRINMTPTHVAVMNQQPECVAWLVRHGISLGIQDHMGDTALHKAAQYGNLECVKLLISHGPLLSMYNQSGKTPLDLAIDNGHREVQAFLEQAQVSQHTEFYPTKSSPILMNGEGIYQNRVPGNKGAMLAPPQVHAQDMDMEMAEDGGGIGGQGDPSGGNLLVPPQPQGFAFGPPGAWSCKRLFMDDDDDEEAVVGSVTKRRRLYAPSMEAKLGTADNNNVLSSYQGVLAMSVEPLKPAPVPLNNGQGSEVMTGCGEDLSDIEVVRSGSECHVVGSMGMVGVCARRHYDYRCAALHSHMI